MRSIIYIITISAIDSLFKSSSFRVIELFFLFIFETIQVNHIINNYKHVFNYYKHTHTHIIITLAYTIRFKEAIK